MKLKFVNDRECVLPLMGDVLHAAIKQLPHPFSAGKSAFYWFCDLQLELNNPVENFDRMADVMTILCFPMPST